MAKKIENKGAFNTVLNVGYLLVIMLVFSPLVFLIADAFSAPVEDCYASPRPVVEDQNDEYYSQLDECYRQSEATRQSNNEIEFYVVSAVSIVAVLLLLLFSNHIASLISYGLFFGSSLNTIIVIIKNAVSSAVGAVVGLVLFVLILAFINRQLKK